MGPKMLLVLILGVLGFFWGFNWGLGVLGFRVMLPGSANHAFLWRSEGEQKKAKGRSNMFFR